MNPGNYASPASWGGPANQISSARALPPPGTTAIALFQDSDFRGRMLVLSGSSSSLPFVDFNDKLTSVIVTGGTWRLYEHTNYQGSSVDLGTGQYSSSSALNPAGGNDIISSVRKL